MKKALQDFIITTGRYKVAAGLELEHNKIFFSVTHLNNALFNVTEHGEMISWV